MYTQLPGGLLPSPVKYFQQNGDLMAVETSDNSVTTASSAQDRVQQPRLGYPLYSGTSLMGGYGGTSPGVVSPVKLDLGGLLLGTVVGLGAVLLIPKLVSIFSYNHHYGRAEEGGVSVSAGLADVMSRVDEALASQNINSTACMERAACSLSQTSLDTITRNPLVSFLVEGSRLERALQAGRSGQSCGLLYPRCGVNYQSISATFDNVAAALQT
ncbi:uncharacterized protein LOC128984431 [Macrosteles quadrilineatus]|uniref:uncharacterized protein LOC128984431 n=1 Tax=Macrosteles quadrilineatus TaxID=74068 RepID=UPI0023E0BE5F|nr:uncharacterized protein LOC128984431 [Macrosteles quadrilineatus]